jgi:hypothetical protein
VSAADGRFQKGYDPRRNGNGSKGGMSQHRIEQRRAEDAAAKAQQDQLDADTTMPLDFILRTMRNPDLDRHERFQAAVRAAPYCHPQLQAVAHQHLGADGKPIAPMVTVVVMETPPEQPRLTHEGPKESDKVQ